MVCRKETECESVIDKVHSLLIATGLHKHEMQRKYLNFMSVHVCAFLAVVQ